MKKPTKQTKTTDRDAGWEAGTWDGARREQLRRWSRLSLEEIINAQEEMAGLADALAGARSKDRQGN